MSCLLSIAQGQVSFQDLLHAGKIPLPLTTDESVTDSEFFLLS